MKKSDKMSVSVIIPTFNEAGNIKRLLAEMPKGIIDEVIFVDGDSPDGTADVVRETDAKLVMQKSKGFGAAFIEGVEASLGDIIIMMDADGNHNPKDIPKFLDKLNKGYDCAFGSRYTEGSYSDDDTIIRGFGNWLITKLTNTLFGHVTTDTTFMYAAFKRPAYEKLKMESNSYEFCIEILVKANILNLKAAEIPSIERKRFSGESNLNAITDGYNFIKNIFIWRFKLNKLMKEKKRL